MKGTHRLANAEDEAPAYPLPVPSLPTDAADSSTPPPPQVALGEPNGGDGRRVKLKNTVLTNLPFTCAGPSLGLGEYS